MPKNILDVFGQFKLMDDTIFGTNYHRFANRYADFHHIFKTKPINYRNMDEFHQLVHSITLRVKDTEVEHIPKLIESNVTVYLSSKTQKVYEQMAKEAIVELDNEAEGNTVSAGHAAIKALKLQQITGGFLMDTKLQLGSDGETVEKIKTVHPVGTEKLDVCMDLVDKYIDGHKIIIGCRFVYEITTIAQALTKKKIKFGIVKGGISSEQRTAIKKNFQNDEEFKVVIFQVSAATSITLTAGNIGILFSCTHKWDDYFQWVKRINRDGQTRPCYILRLVAKGSVDGNVLKAIDDKRSLSEGVMDKSAYRTLLTPNFHG